MNAVIGLLPINIVGGDLIRCCSNCVVGARSVVRHNSVVEGCEVPEGFCIPSTTNIHSNSDLSKIESVTPQAMDFSEDVARTNIDLVKGYKKLQNEF